eukprot:15366592-Ditylum_brightwellii.AAC.1
MVDPGQRGEICDGIYYDGDFSGCQLFNGTYISYATTSPTKTPSELPSQLPSQSPSTLPSESPSELPSQSPLGLPSQSPTTTYPSATPTASLSTIPTTYPSATPTTYPSLIPTSTPTSTKTTTPTAIPSDVPSSILSIAPSKLAIGWHVDRIGNATVVFDDTSVNNEITILYNISHSRHPMVTVYEDDCKSTVPQTVVGVTSNTHTSNNPMYDLLDVYLDIKQEAIPDSSIWNDNGNTGIVNICVRVDLISDYDQDGTLDSIAYQNTLLSLEVNMEQGINIDVLAESNEVKKEEQSVDLQYNVTACQCDYDLKCIQNPDPLRQNSALRTCVFSHSSDVQIKGMHSLVLKQGSLSVSSITDGAANEITSVKLGADETSAIITTQLNSAFFVNENPSNVVVEGITVLSFGSTSGRKIRKRGLQQQSGEGKSNFQVELKLEGKRDENEGGESTERNANNASTFLIGAIGIVFFVVLLVLRRSKIHR